MVCKARVQVYSSHAGGDCATRRPDRPTDSALQKQSALFRMRSTRSAVYSCFVFPLENLQCVWDQIDDRLKGFHRARKACRADSGLATRPRTPHTARLRAANFVVFAPSARMRSAIPSRSRSHTARVASGVTSRWAMPVPPVVTTNRACALKRMRTSRIADSSSGTISRDNDAKVFLFEEHRLPRVHRDRHARRARKNR